LKNEKELLDVIVNALEDKKGMDVSVLDVSKISSIADYFIIAGASNVNQMNALVDSVEEALYKEGVRPAHIEGGEKSGWTLMNYGDIIVHVFDVEKREFYGLERVWKDAEKILTGNASEEKNAD